MKFMVILAAHFDARDKEEAFDKAQEIAQRYEDELDLPVVVYSDPEEEIISDITR
jgi:hypothetical protein